MDTKRCTYQGCSTKFPDGIIHLKGKYGVDLQWWPDGAYLFHYQDTHGFPHEMMIEDLRQLVDTPMTEDDKELYRSLLKQSIVDQAYNTKH